MNTSSRRYTIRFDPRVCERIEGLARNQDCNPSDVIRAAVNAYLATSNMTALSSRRMARISEFVQLALDVIISEQYPEFRERIIANTDKRLEQYHGA